MIDTNTICTIAVCIAAVVITAIVCYTHYKIDNRISELEKKENKHYNEACSLRRYVSQIGDLIRDCKVLCTKEQEDYLKRLIEDVDEL